MSNRAYYSKEREAAFARDCYRCIRCGKPANQAAHGIPNRGAFVRLYGRKLIDSRHNLQSACSLECNAALQKRVQGPAALAAEVAAIEAAIKKQEGK